MQQSARSRGQFGGSASEWSIPFSSGLCPSANVGPGNLAAGASDDGNEPQPSQGPIYLVDNGRLAAAFGGDEVAAAGGADAVWHAVPE